MKRIIALTLAVLMLAALFSACGEKKKSDADSKQDATTAAAEEVITTVDSKYDDGFAEKYAKSVTTDDSGNKVYEFDSQSYENYARDYNNSISAEITDQVAASHDASFGQYCYINNEKKAVIVGVNPGQYNEDDAKAEAPSLAKSSFPYFKGLQEDVVTVSVIYCNANNQDEIYGQFDFPIE